MYFALGSVVLLVIGGLSGVFTGVIPVDWQAHNTYYVVGHIHYVLIGSNVFPVFAGFYYWLPKMTGRMMNERSANGASGSCSSASTSASSPCTFSA